MSSAARTAAADNLALKTSLSTYLGPRPAPGLQRPASHPAGARPARHPRSSAAGARHAHPPGGGPPAPPPPPPLWFWWWGPTPPDLAEVWQAYIARFAIAHTCRFFKQALKWTTPKRRAPSAADRWTWLLIRAFVHCRRARDHVPEVRLPWQRPLPPERRTPARVRRGFSYLLAQVGSPARVPQPCGRSPGRPKGQRSPPAQRVPAVTLTP